MKTTVTIERGIAFFEDGSEVSNVSPELIAAAPELLEALEKCAGHTSHYASMPRAHSDAWKDVAAAHAAIAKAKGGNNV